MCIHLHLRSFKCTLLHLSLCYFTRFIRLHVSSFASHVQKFYCSLVRHDLVSRDSDSDLSLPNQWFSCIKVSQRRHLSIIKFSSSHCFELFLQVICVTKHVTDFLWVCVCVRVIYVRFCVCLSVYQSGFIDSVKTVPITLHSHYNVVRMDVVYPNEVC